MGERERERRDDSYEFTEGLKGSGERRDGERFSVTPDIRSHWNNKCRVSGLEVTEITHIEYPVWDSAFANQSANPTNPT